MYLKSCAAIAMMIVFRAGLYQVQNFTVPLEENLSTDRLSPVL